MNWSRVPFLLVGCDEIWWSDRDSFGGQVEEYSAAYGRLQWVAAAYGRAPKLTTVVLPICRFDGQLPSRGLLLTRHKCFEVCDNQPEMKRKKNPKPVGLGIKDLIVAMDQGGVKHCQRGTLKQRDHSKND